MSLAAQRFSPRVLLSVSVLLFGLYVLLPLSILIPLALSATIAASLRNAIVALGCCVAITTCCTALVRAFARALRARIKQVIALRIIPGSEPRIEALIVGLCREMGVKIPDFVLIHAEPLLFVVQGRYKVLNGYARGRIMAIGLPLLYGLSSSQLRAVLAHELAHFIGLDTFYSALVLPAYIGLGAAAAELRRMGDRRETYWSLLFRFPQKLCALATRALIETYLRRARAFDRSVGRIRELRADAIAACTCGTESFRAGLTTAVALPAVFSRFLGKTQQDGNPEGDGPDIYARFGAALADLQAELAQETDKALKQPTSLDASHPSLTERLDSLPNTPHPMGDHQPAVNLLERPTWYGQALAAAHMDLASAVAQARERDAIVGLSQQRVPVRRGYAHFWRRLGAGMIDFLLVMLLARAAFWLNGQIAGYELAQDVQIGTFAIGLLLYSAILESSLFRATVGKMLLRMCVTDLAGRRLTFWRALLRAALRTISLGSAGLHLVFTLVTKRRQTHYDLLLKCVVVRWPA